MDAYERIGYLMLANIVIVYVAAMVYGLIPMLPWGLLGLALITGAGVKLVKVIKQRIHNKS